MVTVVAFSGTVGSLVFFLFILTIFLLWIVFEAPQYSVDLSRTSKDADQQKEMQILNVSSHSINDTAEIEAGTHGKTYWKPLTKKSGEVQDINKEGLERRESRRRRKVRERERSWKWKEIWGQTYSMLLRWLWMIESGNWIGTFCGKPVLSSEDENG